MKLLYPHNISTGASGNEPGGHIASSNQIVYNPESDAESAMSLSSSPGCQNYLGNLFKAMCKKDANEVKYEVIEALKVVPVIIALTFISLHLYYSATDRQYVGSMYDVSTLCNAIDTTDTRSNNRTLHITTRMNSGLHEYKLRNYLLLKDKAIDFGEDNALSSPVLMGITDGIKDSDGENNKNRICSIIDTISVFVNELISPSIAGAPPSKGDACLKHNGGYATLDYTTSDETSSLTKADSAQLESTVLDLKLNRNDLIHSIDEISSLSLQQINIEELMVSGKTPDVSIEYIVPDRADKGVYNGAPTTVPRQESIAEDLSHLSKHNRFTVYSTKIYIYGDTTFSCPTKDFNFDSTSRINKNKVVVIFFSCHGETKSDSPSYYYRIGSDDNWKSINPAALTVVAANRAGYLEFLLPQGVKSPPIFIKKY
jgi:hypothetical protein